MLKKAPLSTVNGTEVPLMPTVATAREPTILTGICRDETWQTAWASTGKAATSAATATAQRRDRATLSCRPTLSPVAPPGRWRRVIALAHFTTGRNFAHTRKP